MHLKTKLINFSEAQRRLPMHTSFPNSDCGCMPQSAFCYKCTPYCHMCGHTWAMFIGPPCQGISASPAYPLHSSVMWFQTRKCFHFTQILHWSSDFCLEDERRSASNCWLASCVQTCTMLRESKSAAYELKITALMCYWIGTWFQDCHSPETWHCKKLWLFMRYKEEKSLNW